MAEPMQISVPPELLANTVSQLESVAGVETLGPLMSTLGLTFPLGEGIDERPKWVRSLSKKVLDAFLLVEMSKGKSDEWKEGARTGTLFSMVCLMRENKEWFGKLMPPELLESLLGTIESLITLDVTSRIKASGGEAADYFTGYGYTSRHTLQPSGLPTGGSHRMILDLVLLVVWKHVLKCRTISEVYALLGGSEENSNQWLGDFETFQRYCRNLGIRLAPRGRPKKAAVKSPMTS